jgi:hypothetical protein
MNCRSTQVDVASLIAITRKRICCGGMVNHHTPDLKEVGSSLLRRNRCVGALLHTDYNKNYRQVSDIINRERQLFIEIRPWGGNLLRRIPFFLLK